jgi:anti-anti-sigma regulatory factor
MEIIVSEEKGKVPVGVLYVKGDLDASSYLKLVEAAQTVYSAGKRDLLLDLSEVTFISSAGLASLHIITKMFRGERADTEDGWGTHKSLDRERENGMQKNVKLLKPSAVVDQVLETVGFKQFFEIYTDLGQAVQSFD